MQMRRRQVVGRALAGLLAAVCLGAQVPSVPAQTLLEGFEDLEKVSVAGGKLSAFKAPGSVTEGEQAAQLPPQASVAVKTDAAALNAAAWLLVDTHTLEPTDQPLEIRFRGAELNEARPCWVQAGKDTLAVPLSVISGPREGGWPAGEITFELSNRGQASVVVDNVRLASAIEVPKETTLLDFAGGPQQVWPGFRPANQTHPLLVWSGRRWAGGHRNPHGFPDPLSGDMVGLQIGDSAPDHVDLKWSGRTGAVAWLWVTHYSDRWNQGAEWSIKVGNRVLAGRKLGYRQMLGAEGILEGLDGDWTPQWYATDYADHFREIIKLTIPSGGVRLELQNCQLAGLVMGPSTDRPALNKVVEQIQEQLVRYRRQFELGHRDPGLCQLTPLAEELKTGMMVLQPPANEAFHGTWQPEAQHRVETLKVVAAAGETIVVPLVAVPLRATGSLNAMLGPLRSDVGRALMVSRGTDVLGVQPVPRVHQARVYDQPWIVSRRFGGIQARRMAHLALVLKTSDRNLAGTYKGELRMACQGGSARVPIEIELHSMGDAQATPAKVYPENPIRLSWYYQELTGLIPELRREPMVFGIEKQFLESGFTGLTVAGPSFGRRGVNTDGFVEDLARLNRHRPDAPPIADIEWAFRQLSRRHVVPRTERYNVAVSHLGTKGQQIADKARLEGHSFLVGNAWSERELSDNAVAARLLKARNAPVALRVHASLMGSPDSLNKDLAPVDTLIVNPNSDCRDRIAAFKKAQPGRTVLINAPRASAWALGFLPAAVGADGVFVGSLAMQHSPYNGHWLDGHGLWVVQSDGGLEPTLNMLWVWQGLSDMSLLRRAEALLAAAKAKGVPADGLAGSIQTIRDLADSKHPNYSEWELREVNVSHEKLAELRTDLIRQAGKVAGQLSPTP